MMSEGQKPHCCMTVEAGANAGFMVREGLPLGRGEYSIVPMSPLGCFTTLHEALEFVRGRMGEPDRSASFLHSAYASQLAGDGDQRAEAARQRMMSEYKSPS